MAAVSAPGFPFKLILSKDTASTTARPGRIFAAARTHTFEQLADAIDDAFARWDRSHLQEFTLADKTRLSIPDPDWDLDDVVTLDFSVVKLSRLNLGEQFVYVSIWEMTGRISARLARGGSIPVRRWALSRTGPGRIGVGGHTSTHRRWDRDDGESALPKDPELSDLPPLRPYWGPDWLRGRR